MTKKVDIAPAVPPSMVRDITRSVNDLRERGAKNILINIPAEDFAATINEVVKHVFVPFTPTLAGEICAPWEKDHVGIFAFTPEASPKPLIYGPDGKPYAEV